MINMDKVRNILIVLILAFALFPIASMFAGLLPVMDTLIFGVLFAIVGVVSADVNLTMKSKKVLKASIIIDLLAIVSLMVVTRGVTTIFRGLTEYLNPLNIIFSFTMYVACAVTTTIVYLAIKSELDFDW